MAKVVWKVETVGTLTEAEEARGERETSGTTRLDAADSGAAFEEAATTAAGALDDEPTLVELYIRASSAYIFAHVRRTTDYGPGISRLVCRVL